MTQKQEIINLIDVLPSNIVEEIYHYALYLSKNARNKEYLDKIQRGIDQCAAGRGLERDIVEVADYE